MYYSSGRNFLDPLSAVTRLNLEPDMKVADFGVGSGAWTFVLVKAVPGGQVYAVDVQKDLLTKIKAESRQRGLSNVEIIWGDIDRAGGSKLKDNFLDAVVLANVLFQVDSVYAAALEAKRTLKPGGKALVVDWSESFGNLGPAPDRVIEPAKAEEIFKSAGFTAAGQSFPAGPHHYGLIFNKP